MGLDTAALISDISGATLLEASDGNWQSVMDSLAPAVAPGLAPRAATFDTHIAPSSECSSTRAKAMASWRTAITWAVAHGALASVLLFDTLAAHGYPVTTHITRPGPPQAQPADRRPPFLCSPRTAAPG